MAPQFWEGADPRQIGSVCRLPPLCRVQLPLTQLLPYQAINSYCSASPVTHRVQTSSSTLLSKPGPTSGWERAYFMHVLDGYTVSAF